MEKWFVRLLSRARRMLPLLLRLLLPVLSLRIHCRCEPGILYQLPTEARLQIVDVVSEKMRPDEVTCGSNCCGSCCLFFLLDLPRIVKILLPKLSFGSDSY